MADFCLECSADIGAPAGWSDFKDVTENAVVLCEGCGFITVDSDGRRIETTQLPDDDMPEDREAHYNFKAEEMP